VVEGEGMVVEEMEVEMGEGMVVEEMEVEMGEGMEEVETEVESRNRQIRSVFQYLDLNT